MNLLFSINDEIEFTLMITYKHNNISYCTNTILLIQYLLPLQVQYYEHKH